MNNKKRISIKSKKSQQIKKNKVYANFSSWRYITVSVIISLIALLLISRLAYLQVVEPEYLANEADKRSLRVTNSIAHRGDISDRHGEELAISVPAYAIWVIQRRSRINMHLQKKNGYKVLK
ncbi:hypothetical protein [Psychromonas sp. MME2]|uniref:hypothetical protein n=1 Tax=Psychromonas sp. MME2 TaxID=3231033 RepID=UPI00339C7FED